ncbi:hypothetical protein SG0102_21860 [Intestinibaculum porci]|uniref:Glycerol-3-phosphate dehydrogenase [NAD(P)+] n=2 Tax=Intestinibaculum porci TaxID=2487118 RepID=A0A3G9J9M0_9FIRM|nr:hypothetical protein SG0102_21860 [Intestinibaculum porci]
MSKIGVLGSGTWGMALARMLANSNHDVTVWSALPQEIDHLVATHKHPNLPDMVIPESLKYTKSIEEICQGRDILLFAVPSVFVRSTTKNAAPYIKNGQIIVDVAKGIETDTMMTMSQVIRDELRKVNKEAKVVALSGPTHAEEVAIDLPTTIVSACPDLETAEYVQDVFMNTCMRVYTNPDVLGVELCGAVKNIIALGTGIAAGLGYGDNTKAALMTRGMAELTRLGTAMGCNHETFSGLAGMGDLIVTATSVHSRNNKCGHLIGQGKSVEEAKKEVGMVVEGINAIPAVMQLAKNYHVEMPIVNAVYEIIEKGISPKDVVMKLMSRDKRSEVTHSLADVHFEQALLDNSHHTGMRRVITYGTFDLLHYGHINLLKRAKALGDYLIVALSTDEFNSLMKGKHTYFSYEQRKQLLEAIRYVDLVIPEESWEQKRSDMHEYHVDTFAIGDDWEGKFDFLKEEGVNVVYLPRTPEISTTQIKESLHKKD